MQRGKIKQEERYKVFVCICICVCTCVCFVCVSVWEMCCNLDMAARKDLTKNVAFKHLSGEAKGWELWVSVLEADMPGVFGEEPRCLWLLWMNELRKLWKEVKSEAIEGLMWKAWTQWWRLIKFRSAPTHLLKDHFCFFVKIRLK